MLRAIPDYKGLYAVTKDGRVYTHSRFKSKKFGWLKPQHSNSGYAQVLLYRKCKRKVFYIHHLVMLVYGPPKPDTYCQINHKDLDKTNNHISNLEWVTAPGNLRHAKLNGAKIGGPGLKGIDNPKAKLTERDVIHIRSTYAKGIMSMGALGRKYGISTSQISLIIQRRSWKHLE